MALLTYNLDTGGEGATCTTANTGCNIINLGAGSVAKFMSAAAAHGQYGVRISAAASTNPAMRWPLSASTNQVSVQVATTAVKELGSGESIAVSFFTLRYSSGTVCSLRYICNDSTSTKKIELAAGLSGSRIGELLTTGVDTTAQYWYTIVVNNLTGEYSVKMYDPAKNLVGSIAGTYGGFSTNPFTHVQAGSGWGAFATTQDIDHIQVDDGSANEIALPTDSMVIPLNYITIFDGIDWRPSPVVSWDGFTWAYVSP